MNLASSDFELFGLSERFEQDRALIDARWKELQREARATARGCLGWWAAGGLGLLLLLLLQLLEEQLVRAVEDDGRCAWLRGPTQLPRELRLEVS